jgi:hypothetical protein
MDEADDFHLFEMLTSGLRILFVGLMYLVALLTAGVGFLKAVAITVILTVVMISKLGRPWIEHFGVAVFLLALFYWTNILPIERWCHSTITLIDRLLT